MNGGEEEKDRLAGMSTGTSESAGAKLKLGWAAE
jgi:hypothetical protein